MFVCPDVYIRLHSEFGGQLQHTNCTAIGRLVVTGLNTPTWLVGSRQSPVLTCALWSCVWRTSTLVSLSGVWTHPTTPPHSHHNQEKSGGFFLSTRLDWTELEISLTECGAGPGSQSFLHLGLRRWESALQSLSAQAASLLTWIVWINYHISVAAYGTVM